VGRNRIDDHGKLDLVVSRGQLQSVEFADIGSVNVNIGPNNAGKTTFLKAILLKNYVAQIGVDSEPRRNSVAKIRIASVFSRGDWQRGNGGHET
jgi:ABC-type Mn2+/Zn2+ transport system ATPase subunit